MTWQLIETAPKDGTTILVYGDNYDGIKAFGITKWEQETAEVWEYTDADTQKKVRKDDSHWDYSCECFPTHWGPLPAPPESINLTVDNTVNLV